MRHRFRFRIRLLLLLVAAAAAGLWGFRAWQDHLASQAPPMPFSGPRLRKPHDDWHALSFPDVADDGEYVSPSPGFLHVRAVADCNAGPRMPAPWDSSGYSYFWVLRVWEHTPTADDGNKGQLVFEHEYRDRLFTVPYGSHVKPEFSQGLPLPPGRYLVQVSIPQMIQSSVADSSTWGPLSSFRVEVK